MEYLSPPETMVSSYLQMLQSRQFLDLPASDVSRARRPVADTRRVASLRREHAKEPWAVAAPLELTDGHDTA